MKTMEDLLCFALDTYARAADDLTKALSGIDTKAQGTATIAGALLAALLTITGREGFSQMVRLMPGVMTSALGAAVLILSLALITSVRAMALLKVPLPYVPDQMADAIAQLRQLPEAEREPAVFENYYADVLAVSIKAAQKTRAALEEKTRRVRWAQLYAVLGAAAVTAIVGVVVLGQV